MKRHRVAVVLLLVAVGCQADPADNNDAGDGTGTTNADGSSGSPTTTELSDSSGELSATSSTATTDDRTDTSADVSTDSSDPDPAMPMICQPACREPVDCCPEPKAIPPGVSCPEDYPFNFDCPDGVCRPGGCRSDAECPPGRECIEANGVALCRVPCTSNDDCMMMPSYGACSGHATDGSLYCDFEFGCNRGKDCHGLGICIDGRCGCTSDADCDPAWGCTPDW